MQNYLVINAEGVVENVVVYNPPSMWMPEDGFTAEPAPPGVWIGWRKLPNGSFEAPPEE